MFFKGVFISFVGVGVQHAAVGPVSQKCGMS